MESWNDSFLRSFMKFLINENFLSFITCNLNSRCEEFHNLEKVCMYVPITYGDLKLKVLSKHSLKLGPKFFRPVIMICWKTKFCNEVPNTISRQVCGVVISNPVARKHLLTAT